MSLTQAEADRLLQLPKAFAPSVANIDFPKVQAFAVEYELSAVGGRERFLLDLERGNLKRARLKFQTRAHKIYVLARLDIDGRPHRNPPDAPHRPGERFATTHLHVYREGFADRVAFYPHEVPDFAPPVPSNDVSWLVAFLRFCHAVSIPQIQETI
jgi:hypothetical protein